jgi:hypothetical protein
MRVPTLRKDRAVWLYQSLVVGLLPSALGVSRGESLDVRMQKCPGFALASSWTTRGFFLPSCIEPAELRLKFLDEGARCLEVLTPGTIEPLISL